jgi:putative ABC transport system permease protein
MLRWWQIRKRDADLDRELRSDLELEEEEQRERGIPAEEARYAARRAFGNSTLIKEQTHEAWGWTPIGRFGQDVRFGIRSLLKSRQFTIAAVLTLALGIGANSAMFSVVRSVLLRPWPFPDPGRLVHVSQRQANGNPNLFPTQDFLDWKQQGGLLARMGAHVSWQVNLSGPGQPPQRIPSGVVSYDFLPDLGIQPMLGRVFSPQEDLSGAGQFVVASFVFWKSHLGSDPGIIGKSIQLDGVPYTVIGVMPAGFNGFDGKELLWTPLQLRRDSGIGSSPNFHWLSGWIRLPDGVTLKQARNELDSVAARLHRANPSDDIGFGVYLQTLNDAFTGDVQPALLMLLGCVGFVLLIACANVANLLLARGAGRRREMAVRAALGASPARIVRQLLTESVLLATAGCAAGIAVAFLLLRGMLAIHPPQVPRIEQTGVDGTVLAYTLLVSAVVGILFGLAPAIDAARVDVNAGLRERSSSPGRGFSRQRSILVIVETALACMLLIGAGLALRSLWSLRNVDLGFVPSNLLTFRIAAPSQLEGAQLSDFYQQIVERIRAVPGVQRAAVARDFPLGGVDPSMPIQTEGKTPPPVQDEIVTRYRAVGDGYFRTLAIPVLRGRAFDNHDTASSAAVAIASESLARKYWPGESPVGKRIKPRLEGSSWCTVVGVAADVRHWGTDVVVEPTAYYPFTQVPASIRSLLEANMGIAVRSTLSQSDLLHSISAAVVEVNRNVPVYDVKSMDSMVADSGSLRNFDIALLAAFSFLALSLAAVGVYAVMAFSVSQRTQEIGVRIALGAHSRDILRLVLWQGVRLAVAGSILGVTAAFFLRKIMANLLYGLSKSDPVILLTVPFLMIFVVLLACWIPARRATKIDPLVALRYE